MFRSQVCQSRSENQTPDYVPPVLNWQIIYSSDDFRIEFGQFIQISA